MTARKRYQTPRVLWLGEVPYQECLARMKAFTLKREDQTLDEFWSLIHSPVYTQGTSCELAPAAESNKIPVVKTDRGGQITYHGPGQLIVYLLIDIKRLGVGPKRLVKLIEGAVINFLDQHKVKANTKIGAPGVYVDERKIAALGLRIKNGKSYHGVSINIDMDLTPFNAIDPCGYKDLLVTQLKDIGISGTFEEHKNQLIDCLIESIYVRTFED